MLIGSGCPGTELSVPELTTIQLDGQRLPAVKSSLERSSTDTAVELHRAELLRLNAPYAQDWRLVSAAQSTVGTGATTETIYLLVLSQVNFLTKTLQGAPLLFGDGAGPIGVS